MNRLSLVAAALVSLAGSGFVDGKKSTNGGRYCDGCGLWIARHFWPCRNHQCPKQGVRPPKGGE